MCRLAAYQGAPIFLEDLISLPEHSLVEQSHAAREAKMSVNGDGFGFVWYGDEREPGLYRDIAPAWANENLQNLARMVKAPVWLAHVRASTFGSVAQSNCHPFTYRNWSFMHNGQIGNFGQHKRLLEAELTDELYAARRGTTDSELLFLLLVSYGLDENPYQAVNQLVHKLKSLDEISTAPHRMSFVMSDGDNLFAVRWSSDTRSPSLYLSGVNKCQTYIVSEPFGLSSDGWDPVEESSFLCVGDRVSIKLSA